MARKILLLCGILASLLYVALLIFMPMRYPGYHSASYTVSELSAIGAPTRAVWVPFGVVYTLLMAAFGGGVLLSAGRNRALRVTGILMIIYGIAGLFWPPMHRREVLAAGGETLTDTLHLVMAGVTVLLMVLGMGFGAAALGLKFRIYSIATIIALMVFGILTSMDAPRVQANLPTPMAGVWERINICLFLLWVMVLSIRLWKDDEAQKN